MTKSDIRIVELLKAIFVFIACWVGGLLLAIFAATQKNNYILLCYFTYLWIDLIGEVVSTSFIKKSKKLENLLLKRYPHTTKLTFLFFMCITAILSWYSFKAFICFAIISIVYVDFKRGFKEIQKQQ